MMVNTQIFSLSISIELSVETMTLSAFEKGKVCACDVMGDRPVEKQRIDSFIKVIRIFQNW